MKTGLGSGGLFGAGKDEYSRGAPPSPFPSGPPPFQTRDPYSGQPPAGGGKSSPALKWLIGGGCGCLTLAGLAVIGLVIWLGSLPESGTVPGGQIPPSAKQFLAEHKLLEPGETVIYFNDDSIRMNNSDLCFFTDQRIVYAKDGVVNRMAWDNVDKIVNSGDWIMTISVAGKDGQHLMCEISSSGDKDFYEALLRTREEKNKDEEKALMEKERKAKAGAAKPAEGATAVEDIAPDQVKEPGGDPLLEKGGEK